jgi:hypothetical protein
MSDDRSQILNMLKEGKISVSEAEELLDAIGKSPDDSDAAKKDVSPPSSRKSPKYLHIKVEETGKNGGKGEKVDIRVPIQLLRAGVKLASVIPTEAKSKVDAALEDKGLNISFDDLEGDKLNELVESLTELTIDVDSEDEKVTIFCE